MMAAQRYSNREILGFLLSDWENYCMEVGNDYTQVKMNHTFAGRSELLDAEIEVYKYARMTEKLAEILQALMMIYNNNAYNDVHVGIALGLLQDEINDHYLDNILDYNLTQDEVVKSEMAGEIAVAKEFSLLLGRIISYGAR